MNRYENFRENGWKSFNDDPIFQGDAPTAKVISYFVKRTRIDDNGGSDPPKEYDYDIVMSTEWLKERLDKTIQYTRKWNPSREYDLIVLQDYIYNQLIKGGYKKGLISKKEFAILSPNKKK